MELLPPPISVHDLATARAVARLVADDPERPLAFATSGDLAQAIAQLEAYRQQGSFRWRPAHRWMHATAPLAGSGSYVDAEAVLRHYVRAAVAGVGGLIWYDLRDDDNDPRHAELLRGFVRRDFSPKTSLLGYSASAGQLTGFRCAGPVAHCDACFDSGLFIGPDRQIAVLLPRANDILPAVLAFDFTVRGRLSAQDFERRDLPVLTSAVTDLVVSNPRPLFVTLDLKEPQPEPQLRMTEPWIRAPQVVFAGQEFTVEIDVPFPLERSYLRLQLPKDSAYRSSVSARKLQGAEEDTLSIPVTISANGSGPPAAEEVGLRVSLEGRHLDIPLQIEPVTLCHPRSRSSDLRDARYQLATLNPPDEQRASASATLHAGYTARELSLLIQVEDDRYVPLESRSADAWGDALVIGLTRVGQDAHAVMRLNPAADPLAVDVLYARGAVNSTAWRARVRETTGPTGASSS